MYLDLNVPLATTKSSIEDILKDLEAGIYCLYYITKCSWREWNNGFRILFFRWIPEFKTFVRDGIPVCWINQDRTKYKRPQPPISDTKVHDRVLRKLVKVKDRGYIQSGYVKY